MSPAPESMERLPAWLGHDLVAGTLPWSLAAPGTLGSFLQHHSLRNARWLGLYAEPGGHATLLLRWDVYWSRDEAPRPAPAEPCALLAVRFDSLDRAELKLRDAALASVVSGATNRAADAHRTHLVDRHGGDATLLHSPGVRLLCLGAGREVLPLLVPVEMF